jgi:vacuolar-type H+-ATPase subunit H
MQNCGSLAEAALEVNGVFAAAEAAAKQYLDNIRYLSGQADKSVEEARQTAQALLLEAQTQAAQILASAKLEAEGILSAAQQESRQIRAAAMETWESFIGSDGNL